MKWPWISRKKYDKLLSHHLNTKKYLKAYVEELDKAINIYSDLLNHYILEEDKLKLIQLIDKLNTSFIYVHLTLPDIQVVGNKNENEQEPAPVERIDLDEEIVSQEEIEQYRREQEVLTREGALPEIGAELWDENGRYIGDEE